MQKMRKKNILNLFAEISSNIRRDIGRYSARYQQYSAEAFSQLAFNIRSTSVSLQYSTEAFSQLALSIRPTKYLAKGPNTE